MERIQRGSRIGVQASLVSSCRHMSWRGNVSLWKTNSNVVVM
jgi:hypothetical protein